MPRVLCENLCAHCGRKNAKTTKNAKEDPRSAQRVGIQLNVYVDDIKFPITKNHSYDTSTWTPSSLKLRWAGSTLISIATSTYNRYINWLAYAIIVYASIPNRLFAEIRYCMDPSWQYALNRAIEKEYVFGKDFVFTYGPLGFLSTGLPLYGAGHGVSILLYKAGLFLGLSAIGVFAIRRAEHIGQKAGILLIYGLAGRLYSYESSVYYLLLFLSLLLWHQRSQKNYWLYIALAFAVLNFYIKLNTGLLVWIMLGSYLLVLLFRKQLGWLPLSGMILGAMAGLWLIARATHTDLPAYLNNGWEIVKHFSAAETYPVSAGSATLLEAMGILLAFAVLIIGNTRQTGNHPFTWVNSFLVSACLFVLFKQGFVRGSYNHQVSFFAGSLILLLIFFLQVPAGKTGPMQIVPGIAILALAGAAILQIGIYGFGFSPLKDLYTPNDNRIVYLPDRIKQTISNNSIDLLPFEAMHLYYNGLNYTPRPIPQGYQAYSGALDSLNAGYYQGSQAPQFVLLSNGSIDNRHPFWDEFQTKQTIRANYTVVDSVRLPDRPDQAPIQYWLLKKKETPVKIPVMNVGPSLRLSITDSIDCTDMGVDALLKIQLEANLPGKLKAFLFQPTILTCHIQYTGGQQSQYDAITPILAAGVPVGRRLETDADIGAFLRQETPSPANRVQKIWFTGNTTLFKNNMTLQVLTVKEE